MCVCVHLHINVFVFILTYLFVYKYIYIFNKSLFESNCHVSGNKISNAPLRTSVWSFHFLALLGHQSKASDLTAVFLFRW